MSWRTISREELAKTIPVSPPNVNKKINPKAHIKEGVDIWFLNNFTALAIGCKIPITPTLLGPTGTKKVLELFALVKQ